MYSTVTITYCGICLKVAKRVDFKSSHCVVCVLVSDSLQPYGL